jgi:hypothetical protein
MVQTGDGYRLELMGRFALREPLRSRCDHAHTRFLSELGTTE